jgi:hypothetical protein
VLIGYLHSGDDIAALLPDNPVQSADDDAA